MYSTLSNDTMNIEHKLVLKNLNISKW